MKRAWCAPLAALLTACAQTPPLPAPALEAPAAWHNAAPDMPGTPTLEDWWASLGDRVLTELIAQALAGNRDLATAAARLREARATAGIAGSWRLPSADASGAGGLRRDDLQAERLRFPAARQSFHQLGVDASWEIDLFGGVRAGAAAADADAAAAAYALADVQVTLAAEVAREYFALRGAQARLDVASRNTALQREALALLDSRVRAGLAPELDATRARADLALLEASQAPLAAAIATSGYRLALLTGAAPGALTTMLETPRPLPDAPDVVPLDLPSSLLARRPDVRRAEAAVLAANERIGVARAALLPRFYLSGLLARAEEDNGAVSFGPGLLYSIGPTVRLPIFNAGRLRAQVDVADARLAQALAQHEQAMLAALTDVETALVGLRRELERERGIARAVTSARLARSLAHTRYLRGLTDYFAVIDAQRALQASEDALASSKTAAVQQVVALYKAMGGGWQATDTPLAISSAAP